MSSDPSMRAREVMQPVGTAWTQARAAHVQAGLQRRLRRRRTIRQAGVFLVLLGAAGFAAHRAGLLPWPTQVQVAERRGEDSAEAPSEVPAPGPHVTPLQQILSDGSRVTLLTPDAQVNEAADPTVVTLTAGAARFDVPPREPPLAVRMGLLHLRVAGSAFTLRPTAGGASLTVHHGAVAYLWTPDNQTYATLEAGQFRAFARPRPAGAREAPRSRATRAPARSQSQWEGLQGPDRRGRGGRTGGGAG